MLTIVGGIKQNVLVEFIYITILFYARCYKEPKGKLFLVCVHASMEQTLL